MLNIVIQYVLCYVLCSVLAFQSAELVKWCRNFGFLSFHYGCACACAYVVLMLLKIELVYFWVWQKGKIIMNECIFEINIVTFMYDKIVQCFHRSKIYHILFLFSFRVSGILSFANVVRGRCCSLQTLATFSIRYRSYVCP